MADAGNISKVTILSGDTYTVKDPNAVSFSASQSLTSTQQTTARTNIGAGTYSKPSGGIPASDLANTYASSATASGSASKTEGIPYGEVDSTSTATVFTATVAGITELKDGTVVLLKNGVVTSTTNFTININSLGAKPVYNNMETGNDTTPTAPTRDTTIFNINYTMLFIYSTTLVDGGAWICYRGYDANTNTIGYQLRTNNTVKKVSDTARYYKIYFTSANGTLWVPASVNSTNNTTSKRDVNQRPIDPFGRIVYTSANSNYTSGSNLAATTIWDQYNISLGYSFNRTGAALTLTTQKPVYIKCAPQSNGSAIMDATTPYVQDLPTSNDGKIYIFLGVATSATQIELYPVHPVYWYDGTGIRLWTGASISRNNVTYTQNSNISVAGTTKTTYTYDQSAIYAPNGLIMGGTAAAAGLATRGVCGVSTPTTGGACTKDNLFINYDGDNTYRSDRQLVLQAGATGTHYGSNLYQYCAARGDAVKGYIDSRVTNYGMLPAVTSSDNDKVLKVENGAYTLGSGGSSATAMTDQEIEDAVTAGWGVEYELDYGVHLELNHFVSVTNDGTYGTGVGFIDSAEEGATITVMTVSNDWQPAFTRKDTSASISTTTVTTNVYSFTMPESDVYLDLYYDD